MDKLRKYERLTILLRKGVYGLPREAILETSLFEGFYDVVFGWPEVTELSISLDENFHSVSSYFRADQGGYPDDFSESEAPSQHSDS